MKTGIKIGFWNYVNTGVLDAEKAADDWKDLGMNMPMSFEFDPEKHRSEEMLSQLDACAKRGMKLIVCDARTTYSRYAAVGEAAFREGVKEAAAAFGKHPAFFGFHVGDEPDKNMWHAAERAYTICREETEEMPFINFFPYWDEENFKDVLGVECAEYEALIEKFLCKTGARKFGYDYYGQCAYFERSRYVDLYFKNLNLFGRTAMKYGADLYVSLLSVGHWSLVVPDEDLIRWQISTAIAHGAAGLLWFFVYERRLDGSFRLPPIDLFWEKTETFPRLSRQNRTLLAYYDEDLSQMDFAGVKHFGGCFGDTEEFVCGRDITYIRSIVNPTPLAVSEFTKDGYSSYLVANLSQKEPTCVEIGCAGGLESCSGMRWIAPGQMVLLLHEKHQRKKGRN